MSKPETISIDLNTVPLKFLIVRVQTLQDQEERIRKEKAYLKGKIADRLAAGESEHDEEASVDAATAEALAGEVPPADRVDAEAPGAVIEASAAA